MSYIDSEQNFFGREDILELLKKRVLGLKEGYRQNVALLGNQYVGKSSILKHFILNLDDKDIVTIYLDLENKDFSYFFHKFIGSLLYNFSKNQNLPLHDDLNLLLETTKPLIPQTVEVICKIRLDYKNSKINNAYMGLLTLPEVFTNETGKFCLLILDEFQSIEGFLVSEAFQNLGKKVMTQKRCLYVVVSSFPQIAQGILSEKLSLLFGNFEMIMLEHFTPHISQQFIENNLEECKIGAQLRNFITDFTGGHPLYLNLVCQELINLSAIHKQDEIYNPLLTQAIENTIFDRWGVISRHFELIINELASGKGNRIIASILMAISNGKHKADELIEEIDVKKSQLTQKISRLIDLGVIIKNGNFYYFKDKLFKYWIKYVYQKRLKDVELAPDKQRKQFKEEFHACVEGFNITSRKDLSSRIIELLYCFDNEAFQLNGRRYKLPQFRKVTPFKIRNDVGVYFDVIKASASDTEWFVVLKKESFGEGDVSMVVAEAKKLGKKPDRCLIISLTDLDENARLKALQERFWIWNEGEVNTLLTLFNKPYIL